MSSRESFSVVSGVVSGVLSGDSEVKMKWSKSKIDLGVYYHLNLWGGRQVVLALRCDVDEFLVVLHYAGKIENHEKTQWQVVLALRCDVDDFLVALHYPGKIENLEKH